jgi:hypothetical protein
MLTILNNLAATAYYGQTVDINQAGRPACPVVNESVPDSARQHQQQQQNYL